jgi:hypothetical protein
VAPLAEPSLRESSWYVWHAPYDALDSVETDRLSAVQDVLGEALDGSPAGPLRVVSACAGQARDLLPVLIHHPRGRDVTARLIELDPLNAAFLDGALGSTRLTGVEVVRADAGETSAYAGAVPADLVLLCGVFANVDPGDAARTAQILPCLCRPGGLVVWSTYGAAGTGPVRVNAVLGENGFVPVAVREPADRGWTVGAHRFTGRSRPLPDSTRFFRFVS